MKIGISAKDYRGYDNGILDESKENHEITFLIPCCSNDRTQGILNLNGDMKDNIVIVFEKPEEIEDMLTALGTMIRLMLKTKGK
jgi:hypothetical protein